LHKLIGVRSKFLVEKRITKNKRACSDHFEEDSKALEDLVIEEAR
jgi:hypothetical protein